MEKKKISVIIPVYKVEKFIHACVDSVLQQTYDNLEVILVDDGSPDQCPEICDQYAQQDARVRVIHQEKQGDSAARNAAISPQLSPPIPSNTAITGSSDCFLQPL